MLECDLPEQRRDALSCYFHGGILKCIFWAHIQSSLKDIIVESSVLFLFLDLFILYFICVGVLLVCVYVPSACLGPSEARGGTRSPWTGLEMAVSCRER